MPVITLPDGSQRTFDSAVSVMAIAEDIGPGLAKATLAGRVDGQLVDASYEIEADAEVAIITGKNEEALELIEKALAIKPDDPRYKNLLIQKVSKIIYDLC